VLWETLDMFALPSQVDPEIASDQATPEAKGSDFWGK
jgi:hypothetical protein